MDHALAHLHPVTVPQQVSSGFDVLPAVPARAPRFVRDVLGQIIAGHGDELPVSALPVDGTFPTATARWEKRNIAQQIPVWDKELCIQCGKCVLVCPHAVIRAKVYDSLLLSSSPQNFKSSKPRWREFETLRYTLQVSPEDCTGCRLCVEACPAKSKSESKHKAINMQPQPPLRKPKAPIGSFFSSCRNSIATPSRTAKRKMCNCWSLSSNFPARVPAAAKHPTSSSSRNFSAIAF